MVFYGSEEETGTPQETFLIIDGLMPKSSAMVQGEIGSYAEGGFNVSGFKAAEQAELSRAVSVSYGRRAPTHRVSCDEWDSIQTLKPRL
jgi:hypothetical protein